MALGTVYQFVSIAVTTTNRWHEPQKCIVSQFWTLEVQNLGVGRVPSF